VDVADSGMITVVIVDDHPVVRAGIITVVIVDDHPVVRAGIQTIVGARYDRRGRRGQRRRRVAPGGPTSP